MTLVEAVLALSLTVVIGLIATSLTAAMLDLRRSTDDYTQNVQSARLGLAQLQHLIRTSRVVVAGDSTSMTLWTSDEKDPGKMNAEEVVRLTYSPGDDAVLKWCVDFSDLTTELSDALNITISLDLGTDWNVTLDLMNSANLEVSEVVTDLSSICFRYDLAPPYTRAVAIDAVFGTDEEAATVHTAAALRTPKTSPAELAEAEYTAY